MSNSLTHNRDLTPWVASLSRWDASPLLCHLCQLQLPTASPDRLHSSDGVIHSTYVMSRRVPGTRMHKAWECWCRSRGNIENLTRITNLLLSFFFLKLCAESHAARLRAPWYGCTSTEVSSHAVQCTQWQKEMHGNILHWACMLHAICKADVSGISQWPFPDEEHLLISTSPLRTHYGRVGGWSPPLISTLGVPSCCPQ